MTKGPPICKIHDNRTKKMRNKNRQVRENKTLKGNGGNENIGDTGGRRVGVGGEGGKFQKTIKKIKIRGARARSIRRDNDDRPSAAAASERKHARARVTLKVGIVAAAVDGGDTPQSPGGTVRRTSTAVFGLTSLPRRPLFALFGSGHMLTHTRARALARKRVYTSVRRTAILCPFNRKKNQKKSSSIEEGKKKNAFPRFFSRRVCPTFYRSSVRADVYVHRVRIYLVFTFRGWVFYRIRARHTVNIVLTTSLKTARFPRHNFRDHIMLYN